MTSTSNSQFARILGVDTISPSDRINTLNAMMAAQPENRKTLYSATGRWMVELSALQEAMETARFTPSFCLEHLLEAEPNLRHLRAAPAVYPQVCAHDLTCVAAIRAVCVSRSQENAPRDLGTPIIDDPIQTYQYMAKVQDRTIAFQTMVKQSYMNTMSTGVKGPSMVMMSSSGRSRHVIVVAIVDSEACGRILDVVNALLIPGVDEFHLVHVCKNAEALRQAGTMFLSTTLTTWCTLYGMSSPEARRFHSRSNHKQSCATKRVTLIVVRLKSLTDQGRPKWVRWLSLFARHRLHRDRRTRSCLAPSLW